MSTTKGRLRSHILADHGGKELPRSWTLNQMASWHAGIHHRYRTSHYHEGSNTGPDDRPPGWRTGEDVRSRS
jgi:hypothetical protein